MPNNSFGLTPEEIIEDLRSALQEFGSNDAVRKQLEGEIKKMKDKIYRRPGLYQAINPDERIEQVDDDTMRAYFDLKNESDVNESFRLESSVCHVLDDATTQDVSSWPPRHFYIPSLTHTSRVVTDVYDVQAMGSECQMAVIVEFVNPSTYSRILIGQYELKITATSIDSEKSSEITFRVKVDRDEQELPNEDRRLATGLPKKGCSFKPSPNNSMEEIVQEPQAAAKSADAQSGIADLTYRGPKSIYTAMVQLCETLYVKNIPWTSDKAMMKRLKAEGLLKPSPVDNVGTIQHDQLENFLRHLNAIDDPDTST